MAQRKVLTVVGARPQFVKAAVLSRLFEGASDMGQVLVHTGQHYDRNMSGLFFDELGMPDPDYNLGISGGSHAQMTARMMEALEPVMVSERPDMVLVYGDTNSTLAAALTAVKLYLPVCHVEGGFRTRSRTNPEEINRICTDHVASLVFAPTTECMGNLEGEGLGGVSSFTGDIMFDAFLSAAAVVRGREHFLTGLDGGRIDVPGEFVYLTCHREENDRDGTIAEVVRAAQEMPLPVVYPVHPRMQGRVRAAAKAQGTDNLLLVEPVGYLESVALLERASFVVTDSGGLQREAFFAGKKCVTLLPFASANETLSGNRNTLVTPVTADAVLAATQVEQTIDASFMPFGDGRAAEKMLDAIRTYFMIAGQK